AVVPCHRKQYAALNSGHLWCARYVGEHPLFKQACRRTMCFQVGGVDHQLVRLAAFGRQRCKDLVKHTHAAPADEPVVDRLMRTVSCRHITPSKAVADYEDNAADHPTIIDPRHTM